MTHPPQHAVRIAPPSAAGPMSKVRKKFNTLVKQLETERARLALWREELPRLRAMADSELGPLAQAFDDRRRQLVELFDRAWSDKSMTLRDREKLSDAICPIALSLMEEGQDDDALREIYDRHSVDALDPDVDADFMREIMGAATGVELDDDADLSSPHAIFEAIRKKMEQQAQEHEAEQADKFQAEQSRPKSAKTRAREERHAAEETKLKQSVRDIFRKLASALHPDRETDPAERTRKTALMQRANAAYAANDLLGLLELQLQVEQIDQNGLDALGEDRIRQYNKILSGQVDEVKAELDAMEFALSMEMGWDFDQRPTVKKMMAQLREQAAHGKAQLARIVADLDKFSDIKKLKAWLKKYRIAPPDHGFDDFFF
jgi:hypothetical protein